MTSTDLLDVFLQRGPKHMTMIDYYIFARLYIMSIICLSLCLSMYLSVYSSVFRCMRLYVSLSVLSLFVYVMSLFSAC